MDKCTGSGMFGRLRDALLAALLLSLVAAPALHARVFLLAGEGLPAGELGGFLGGAQVAMTNGAEAIWHNPAGLAELGSSQITLAGSALRFGARSLGPGAGQSGASLAGLEPLQFAYAALLGSPRGYPRAAFGIALRTQVSGGAALRFNDLRTGSTASLPPYLGADVGTAFPDGFELSEQSEGRALLGVLAPAVALGFAPAAWWRLGLSLRTEQVQLEQSITAVEHYSGASGASTLEGASQSTWSLTGQSLRLAYTLGAQFQLAEGLVLGMTWEPASEPVSGTARLRFQQSASLTVDGGTLQSVVYVDEAHAPFRLIEPARLKLGLLLESDWMVFEMDVLRVGALSPYEVTPEAVGLPPSNPGAARLPALTTSSQGGLGMAFGLAFHRTDRAALLLGLGIAPAYTPPQDGLYRQLSPVLLSAGYYTTQGRLSTALGVQFLTAGSPHVLLPRPFGGDTVSAPVSVNEVALQLGATFTL